jgi:hypothetical protein
MKSEDFTESTKQGISQNLTAAETSMNDMSPLDDMKRDISKVKSLVDKTNTYVKPVVTKEESVTKPGVIIVMRKNGQKKYKENQVNLYQYFLVNIWIYCIA